jgi:hypothetical protein
MMDLAGERALALEREAKAFYRAQQRHHAAIAAARRPKARVPPDARALLPWWSPWQGPPVPGQQSRDWHGHSHVWVGNHWEPVSARLLLDLVAARGVATDESLTGRGRPAAPLSVALVDGSAY